MTTPASIDPHRPLVDIRDMIVVHTAMLREFRLIPSAIRRVPAGNSKRAVIVADHLAFLCDLLHHHHRGEDELLWPKLRSRTEPQALEVIEEVEAQHESIDAALNEVEDRRLGWIENPTDESRETLADELERLHILLADHLDLEERALLPLAAMVLTVDEWHAVGAAGAASIPKSALPVVFGMFAYEGDPGVLIEMLTPAPLLIRHLMPRIAPRAYAWRSRRIYGTSQP